MMTLMDGFDKVSQIEEKMLSEITHFAQYDDIPYVADFKCPECGESGEGYIHKPGGYEWEGLYVDHESDNEDLKIALLEQKRLIEEKYGEYTVKDTINAELL